MQVKSREQLHPRVGRKLIFFMNPSIETAIWAHLENISWKEHQLMLVNCFRKGKERGKSRAMFLSPYFCSSDFTGSYAVILSYFNFQLAAQANWISQQECTCPVRCPV